VKAKVNLSLIKQPPNLFIDPVDLLDRQNTGLSSEFVFLRNQDDDVENLKEELQITEQDFDIHFIEGNFADYFTEGKVLGQGASGVVKKYTRIQDGEVYAVKSIRYRGDTERLLLVAIFLTQRKSYLSHFLDC